MENREKLCELKLKLGKLMGKESEYPSIDKTHLEGTKFSERHPFIPNMSISNAIDVVNYVHSNDSAIDCEELKVSHKELKEDGIAISKAFKELGVKSGDIIPVSMPNYYQGVASFKGANRIGAATTFINPYASIEETKKYLNMYGAKVFINYDKCKDYNYEIKRDTGVKHVITLSSDLKGKREFNEDTNKLIGYNDDINFHDLKLVGNYYKKPFNTLFGGKQVALIPYTSGSTGEQKSIVATNENILSAAIYYRNSAHLAKLSDENRSWMGVVPFMYPYGFCASVLSPMLAGREIILAPNIGPENVDYYFKKNPYLVFGSPAFLELTKRNLSDDVKLDKLKEFVSGGDFLSVQQSLDGKKFFADHGANVSMCNSSGNGETLGCSTNAMGIDYRPETVGQLVLGPKYIVINPDTGKEVKYGEPGVLCTTGKHVFNGYYNNPEKTEETMFNYKGKKYYMTGNYGSLGKDRYFTMIGRASRFFIISTLNKVYCELVQNAVSNIDVVESVAVVPKPNKEMLFESKAYVVLKNGVDVTPEIEQYIIEKSAEVFVDSKDNTETKLKEYEVPASVTFLDTLPRTPHADKINYEYLKNLAAEEYNEELNGVKRQLKI